MAFTLAKLIFSASALPIPGPKCALDVRAFLGIDVGTGLVVPQAAGRAHLLAIEDSLDGVGPIDGRDDEREDNELLEDPALLRRSDSEDSGPDRSGKRLSRILLL